LCKNLSVELGIIDPDTIDELHDDDLLDGYEGNNWLQALKDEGVFFSYPLDLDFSMLNALPEAYQKPNPGGRGPRESEDAIREKKAVTLKPGGSPDLYDEDHDDAFTWCPRPTIA
jgi:putative ATP-dependent endonuclease of the OLD family